MNTPRKLRVFAGYGIELEYMIVDRATLAVKPIADLLCSASGSNGLGGDGIVCSNELALHLIELKNLQPTAALDTLQAAFQSDIRQLNRSLLPAGAQLMPGAMHPWMAPQTETRLWPYREAEIYQAYDRIFDCRRHGFANMQSMQLNLPFADDAEFARLHEAIRLALPLIPALAASSPFADGRWSGFLDYRMETYRTHQQIVPSTMGDIIPESVASRAEYETRILAPMFRDIAAHDPDGILRHEWLNARAAVPRFRRSAIEIRIADVQECPRADMAIAAAVIALVRHLYATGPEHSPMRTPALLSMLQAGIADAEQARLDDTAYLRRLAFPGRRCMAAELWQHLLEVLQREDAELHLWLPTLQFILARGPLARRLLQAVGRDAGRTRLEAVYAELCRCLDAGHMFQEAF